MQIPHGTATVSRPRQTRRRPARTPARKRASVSGVIPQARPHPRLYCVANPRGRRLRAVRCLSSAAARAHPRKTCARRMHAGETERRRKTVNNSTAQTTTYAQKAIALLMALVLCMGLTPHAAWADDAAAGTGEETGQATEQPTVTLTIVKGATSTASTLSSTSPTRLPTATRFPTCLRRRRRPEPSPTMPSTSKGSSLP